MRDVRAAGAWSLLAWVAAGAVVGLLLRVAPAAWSSLQAREGGGDVVWWQAATAADRSVDAAPAPMATTTPGAVPAAPAASATPRVRATAPAPPTARPSVLRSPGRIVVAPGDEELAVSWEPVEERGASYRVEAVPRGGGSARVCLTSTSSCLVRDVENGVGYEVSVTTVVAGRASPSSSPVRAFPYPVAVMTGDRVRLWLDAADGRTLRTANGAPAAAGDGVASWKDKSPLHRDAVQPQAVGRPAVRSLNGQAALGFDGSTDFLQLSASALPTGAAPSTVVVVAVPEASAGPAPCYRHLIGWGDPGEARARMLHKECNGGNAFIETYGQYLSMHPTVGWGDGVAAVVSGTVTASSVSLRINGSTSYSWQGAATMTGADGGAQLGGVPWSGQRWKGRIAEVVVLAGAVDDTQLSRVEDYLATKWGIPAA